MMGVGRGMGWDGVRVVVDARKGVGPGGDLALVPTKDDVKCAADGSQGHRDAS